MQRIYVDFNTLMSEPVDRVKVAPEESADVTTMPWLRDGAKVLLYDEELEVEATLHFDAHYAYWLADPDWSSRRFLSPSAQSGATA